jgi:hypothetical protein
MNAGLSAGSAQPLHFLYFRQLEMGLLGDLRQDGVCRILGHAQLMQALPDAHPHFGRILVRALVEQSLRAALLGFESRPLGLNAEI